MIKYSERRVFEMAVDITKEYARGGGNVFPDDILERVYKKLQKINNEMEGDENK